MPCEMILKTKWDEYRRVETNYWHSKYDIKSMKGNNSNVISNRNIFVYWDKGFDKAPKVVQACYRRLQNYIPKDWTLVTLTEQNVSEYIKMPSFILDMIRGGQIFRANYSDILRTALLYHYGGIWIDSTCFITKDIPKEILDEKLFMFSIREIIPSTPYSFENWFIRANQHDYVMGRVLENMLCFFKQYPKPTQIYFVMYYILTALYNHDELARDIMNKIPFWSNLEPLQVCCLYGLEARIDEKLWNHIMKGCFVQKLTYKYHGKIEKNMTGTILSKILNN